MKLPPLNNDANWKKIFENRKTEALYVWFLFMNERDMAMYLCSRSRVRPLLFSISAMPNYLSMVYLNVQNQTVAALLAVEIYLKAANLSRHQETLQNIAV